MNTINSLKLVLLLLIIFLGNKSFSQDNMILKNGNEVLSKVLEVGANQIKYKKWNNIDGPTYTILKSEIFMIKYKKGSKDVFGNSSGETNNNHQTDTTINKGNRIASSKYEPVTGYRVSTPPIPL